MELRHFRYFVAVAETLHFGRAAARLRIAQPSVSQQIRQLETELQTKLFERTKRHVHLTEEGARFLEEAREVLAHADRAAMSVGRAFEGEGGILRIGLGYYMDETKITRALKLFAERHPAIHAEARHMSVVFQLATLRDELLDVGFVRPPVREALLASDVIISEPLCVALPRKHRFVARKWIELSELADESFILVERDVVPVFREFVLKACADAGFEPRASHKSDHLHIVLAMVAQGIGIALLPEWARNVKNDRMVFRSLGSSAPMIQTAVAWRRDDTSKAVNNFLEIVREIMPPSRSHVAE